MKTTPPGGASVDLIALTCFISLFVVFVVLTRGGPTRATQRATQRAIEAMSGSELSHGLTNGAMAVAGAVQSVAAALTGGNDPCSSGVVERFRADPRTQIQHGTIFVSIAAYRDDECKDTVFDLFDKATRPERVFVGVVQQIKDASEDCFEKCDSCRERKRNGQIRQIDYDFSEARGPCFARYQASKLWRGEEYYMQIDSHMKFEQGWDDTVFAEMARTGDPTAVLSSYPPTEDQMRDFKAADFGQMIINCDPQFNSDGLVSFLAAIVDSPPGPLAQRAAVAAPFCGAGLMIMPGKAIIDVPYDPHLNFLFFGEELMHSARLWTSGYNFYAPVQSFVIHHYGREDKPKFWADRNNYESCRRKAVQRVKYLLGLEPLGSVDPAEYQTDIDVYGPGTKRSLADYFRFAGIDWKAKKATKNCSATGFRN